MSREDSAHTAIFLLVVLALFMLLGLPMIASAVDSQDQSPAIELSAQAIGASDDGEAAIRVSNVTAESGYYIVLTTTEYEVVGGTPYPPDRNGLEAPLDSDNITAVLDPGAPETVVAHVVNRNISTETQNELLGGGRQLSNDTIEHAIIASSDPQPVVTADVEINDQSVTSGTDSITIDAASLSDGQTNDTDFIIELYDVGSAGSIDGRDPIGRTSTLTSTNEDIEIDLNERIESTTELTAVVRLETDTEPLRALSGDSLQPVHDTATLTIQDPASFSVSELDAPGSIASGDSGTVSARITNTGDLAGEQTVTFSVDSTAVDQSTLSLAGGSTRSVEFALPSDLDVGSHTVSISVDGERASESVDVVENATGSDIGIESVTAPDSVNTTDPIEFVVTVENTGDTTGTPTIELRGGLTDSSMIEPDLRNQTEVSVDANTTETVRLVTTEETPGEYTYRVSTANTSRNASVNVTSPSVIVGTEPATDTTGDGLYNDVNGDGSFDIFDVQLFFDARDSDPVEGNSAYFDFTEDGRTDIFDVQALFEQIE